MAAVAPAADMGFQSVEIVDMRLSIATLARFLCSLVFLLVLTDLSLLRKTFGAFGATRRCSITTFELGEEVHLVSINDPKGTSLWILHDVRADRLVLLFAVAVAARVVECSGSITDNVGGIWSWTEDKTMTTALKETLVCTSKFSVRTYPAC